MTEINECERLLDNCQQECMNTDGSFNCSCYDGFLLQDDGRSCQSKQIVLKLLLIFVLLAL